MKFGFRGPNHAATTACTTGAHSIGDAARFIALGDADVMVAGGAESCIHPLAFAGFSRSRSLSTEFNDDPPSSCRPFDRDRSGFVIGEGAAVVVLEELGHAKARGAQIYAELRGYGCSSDAYHMTAPREDGSGAYLAMKKALKQAGLRPNEVDYINAHATATSIGDVAEAAAIRSLMMSAEGYENESEVTVSSTKGSIGHLLGAAGAVEAMFSPGQIYSGLFFFFAIGAIAPIIIWYAAKRWPKSPVKYLMAPLIFGGAGSIPPATPLNYLSWGMVGFVTQYWIKKRHFRWWSRLNFLTSSGLDLGLALATLVIFFAFTLNDIDPPKWWGNDIVQTTMDTKDTAIQVVLPPGQTFGPASW
jgi:hypothetical protein